MDKETAWLLDDKYAGIKTEEFEQDLVRLKNGEPLAYIIGWVPFLNTKIWLDSKPLIPRPETEYWVEKFIKKLVEVRPRPDGLRVLDLCAGSGCIGVAVLKAIPDAQVDFVEIDESHHATIRKNLEVNGQGSQVKGRIFGGNLFENITEKYDVILTNPPYIDPALSYRVQTSVALHEPEQALFGGPGGMELIERIIAEAPKYLNPGGVLYIEHEPEQTEKIKLLAPSAETFTDQFGVERYSKI